MLYIIGLGLKPKHLTIEAIEALKSCRKILVEDYTSGYSEGSKDDLEDMLGKSSTALSRFDVEQGFDAVLEEARKTDVALCVYGNPLNATTHIQMLLDAEKKNVKTKVVPGLSIFEFVSFTGLERYKFGRTTSIVFHEPGYEPEGFYNAILENKKAGLHTLCLLDIMKDEKKMMDIGHAITLLESLEEKQEKSVLAESILVGMAGIGSSKEQIKAGTSEQLRKFPFTSYPQSIVVCGKLNEKEIEGLKKLGGLDE